MPRRRIGAEGRCYSIASLRTRASNSHREREHPGKRPRLNVREGRVSASLRPRSMNLRSTVHEANDVFAAQELFHGRGWTDGLPVVPPTEDAVRACLDGPCCRPITSSGWSRCGPGAHRGEGRRQCGDGGLPADALPRRGDRAHRDAARGVHPPRRHREHRRLRRLHRGQRRRTPRARDGRHVQRARQQRSGERGHRTGDPSVSRQPARRAPGGIDRSTSGIPASSASAWRRTRRTRRGSRWPRRAAFPKAHRRSPSWRPAPRARS